MQKITIYCDRCGVEMLQTDQKTVVQHWNKHYNHYIDSNLEYVDLCSDCRKAFKEFLKKKKNT